jgi:hypothetical protein
MISLRVVIPLYFLFEHDPSGRARRHALRKTGTHFYGSCSRADLPGLRRVACFPACGRRGTACCGPLRPASHAAQPSTSVVPAQQMLANWPCSPCGDARAIIKPHRSQEPASVTNCPTDRPQIIHDRVGAIGGFTSKNAGWSEPSRNPSSPHTQLMDVAEFIIGRAFARPVGSIHPKRLLFWIVV